MTKIMNKTIVALSLVACSAFATEEPPFNPARTLLEESGALAVAASDTVALDMCRLATTMDFAHEHDKAAKISFAYFCNALDPRMFGGEILSLVKETAEENKTGVAQARAYLETLYRQHELKVCDALIRNDMKGLSVATDSMCRALGHPKF